MLRENGYNEGIRDITNSSMFRAVKINGKLQLGEMVSDFNSIFGNITDYSNEISSLKFYPFKAKVEAEEIRHTLHTSRGTTNVECDRIKQSHLYNIGEIFIPKKFNNFLDYKGYTNIKLLLPFLGLIEIDTNEVMGKYLQIRLGVDFTTGEGTYFIGTTEISIGMNSFLLSTIKVFAIYNCDVAIDIPIGSSNFGDVIRNIALGTVKTVATVGASIYSGTMLPPTVTTSNYHNVKVKGAVFKKGRAKNAPKGTRLRMYDVKTSEPDIEDAVNIKTTDKPFNISEPINETISSAVNMLNRSYPSTQNDRAQTPSNMWYLNNQAVVIIYRPNIIRYNEYYKEYYGMPCGEIYSLSSAKGFTKISSIHLENIPFASSSELEMIKEALYNGVILPEE